MFGLGNKTQGGAIVAVNPGAEGLAIASVQGADQSRPALALCQFTPWQSGAVEPHTLAAQAKALRLDKHACTTVMDLGDYAVLSVEAPDVPPLELRAAVRWQIKDLIDFHVDDAIVDVFDAPASGAHGRQNSLYVVVARTATVRKRVDLLQGAKVNLTTIDIPELVLRNIAARLPENEAGLVFVHLARQRGIVTVTRQSTLYFSRNVDFGYEQLRQAAGDRDRGLGMEGGAFDQLVLEVQRSLDYYDRQFVQPPVAGIVIAPTEMEIPGLPVYLKQNLGINTRVLDLNELVHAEFPLDAALQAQCLTAIGAALRRETRAL